jgi:hypothetical protein
MQPDYLKQAKSFLAQNSARLALRVVPMALVAVAAAHAQPVFNAPSSTSVSGCSGGTTVGSLTGSPTNGGVSLSGSSTVTLSGGGACTVLMVWKGTGSGTFSSASYSSTFVLTPPTNAGVSAYSLTILINGIAQTPVTCSALVQPTAFGPGSRLKPRGTAVPSHCNGTITVPLTNISASGALSTYEADLSVTGTWVSENQTTLNVSIPSGASIDITATAPVLATPALSPAALAGTALLLALAAFRMARLKPSNGGGPPRQA